MTDTVPRQAFCGAFSQCTDDPFISLTHELHVSGRLTLFRSPIGTCGEWTCVSILTPDPVWHRRLDANSFLWLRDRVRTAIESGKLSQDAGEALATLDWISKVGVIYGSFTTDEIQEFSSSPGWFEFNSGLPNWADEY